ncbi:MarR family transcriptional regulator [Actinocorallia sp. A-T 12471]|uniref:MarR family winged helix-turn-helix transcriptional regulator n=1 Tax=Actinocorallia sp. A-T 12471 TaxID=3089813 RepID=UPI0029D175AD|nr:MarR family transcriptional regulator [Actinocorallia sp. A-T 12471]MDX6744187.1 MarR family transcriptional regulator [Actinocorallia sp. A-T 12471]
MSEETGESLPYQFTDSVPYLLNRLGVRLGERFAVQLKDHGLTLPMYRVLAALREQGDQRLGDLAVKTSIEKSTLSRLISTMRSDGLVSRERPEDQGRIVAINLTAKGLAVVEPLIPVADTYERAATAGMSAKEVVRFKEILRTMYDNLGGPDEER